MISFSTDSSVQTKIHICSWEECLKGSFIICSYEASKKIYFHDSSDHEDSEESDSDDEAENDTCESVTEENKIRAECVMDAVNPGSCVALYLSPDSFEIIFLYYFIDVGGAPETMVDEYNHIIEKGSMYLKCNYLEKNLKKRKCFLQDVKESCLCIACTSGKSFCIS